MIILLWTLVIISPLLFISNYSEARRAIHIMWTECAVLGVVFIINRLLMHYLLFRKRYLNYTISLGILLSLLTVFIINLDGVNMILELFGAPQHHIPPMQPPIQPPSHPHIGDHIMGLRPPATNIISPMFKLLISSIVTIALDLGLRITVTWFITEQKRSKESQKRAISQLQTLQSQVSPHFFMNTLNNIHALVEIDPQRARQTIIELSDLMSYLLYESSLKKMVSLQQEIEFINNYINLMKLRFSEQVKIDISYNEPPAVNIPPYLFLNFIENAFKYGVDYDNESFIKVQFKFTDSTIEMLTINTNHAKESENKQHGLGINNSRKRLDLLYGDKYTLDISEKENIFYVNLIIPII